MRAPGLSSSGLLSSESQSQKFVRKCDCVRSVENEPLRLRLVDLTRDGNLGQPISNTILIFLFYFGDESKQFGTRELTD